MLSLSVISNAEPRPARLTCLPSSSSRQTCASRLGCPLIKNAILLPIEAKAAMLLHVKVQQLDRTALNDLCRQSMVRSSRHAMILAISTV